MWDTRACNADSADSVVREMVKTSTSTLTDGCSSRRGREDRGDPAPGALYQEQLRLHVLLPDRGARRAVVTCVPTDRADCFLIAPGGAQATTTSMMPPRNPCKGRFADFAVMSGLDYYGWRFRVDGPMPELQMGVRSSGTVPTEVQDEAIPLILGGGDGW